MTWKKMGALRAPSPELKKLLDGVDRKVIENHPIVGEAARYALEEGGYQLVSAFLKSLDGKPAELVNSKSVVCALIMSTVKLAADSGMEEETFHALITGFYEMHKEYLQFVEKVRELPEDQRKDLKSELREQTRSLREDVH